MMHRVPIMPAMTTAATAGQAGSKRQMKVAELTLIAVHIIRRATICARRGMAAPLSR